MNSATNKIVIDIANAAAEAFIDGLIGGGLTAAECFDKSPPAIERAVQAALHLDGVKLHPVKIKAVDAAHDLYTATAMARVAAILT